MPAGLLPEVAHVCMLSGKSSIQIKVHFIFYLGIKVREFEGIMKRFRRPSVKMIHPVRESVCHIFAGQSEQQSIRIC